MNRSKPVSCLVLLLSVAAALLNVPAAASPIPTAGPVAAPEGVDYPVVRVIESGAEGLLLDVQIGGLSSSDVLQDGTVYRRLFLPYSGATTPLGKPELPTFARYLALPQEGEVDVEVLEATAETISNVLIYPTQEPHSDCTGARTDAPFVLDGEFYEQDTVYPGQTVLVEGPKVLRGCRTSLLRFYPFQYNPARQELTAYSHLRVQVRFVDAQGPFIDERVRAESFEPLYGRLLLNYDQLGTPQPKPAPQSPNGAEFLIISHPDLVTEANALAAYRNAQGIDTEVRTTNETGATAAQIQAYIQQAYDTWTPAPEFVLFVGDHEWIPTNYSGSTATDLYYFTVDGADYYPDIHGGRVSVDSLAEAETHINKIIDYDLHPVSDEAFYENVSVAAYFQDDDVNGYEDRRFVLTSEDIRDYLLTEDYEVERIYFTESYVNPTHYNNGYYANGEPLPADLLRPGFAWDGDSADITAAVEAGRVILTHRDHGFYGGWGEPGYTVADVLALTNGNLLPVVFSMNCQSGGFDSSTDPCFTEAWIRNANGGAVGVFGATRNSYSGYNDWMTLGFFDAMWPELLPEVIPGYDLPEYRMGVVMNYGKLMMGMTWGDPWGYQQLEFELFHYFGDPTMALHVEPPFGDFNLAAEPGSLDLCVPSVVTSTIQAGMVFSYTEPITLAALQVPAGVLAGFSPTVVLPSGESLLILEVTEVATDGIYTMVVSGTAEVSNVHTIDLDLWINSDLPGTPELIAPADGDVGLYPWDLTFSWGGLPLVQRYGLQVGTEPTFAAPVVQRMGIMSTTYRLDTSLESSRCYFWRAAGQNGCGEGQWSEPRHFGTVVLDVGFEDYIESGDGNWTHAAYQGSDHWQISGEQFHSPTHAWRVPNDSAVTDSRLWNSVAVPLEEDTTLTFWHRYEFAGSDEDGAVLEISLNGGGSWIDLGSRISANGYNGTIEANGGNPLAGRSAWVGSQSEWVKVEVGLGTFAGEDVHIRWRIGSNASGDAAGWYIDDVLISAPLPPQPAPVLLGVTPEEGSTYSETPVAIQGSGFAATPFVQLGDNLLLEVTVVSSTTLEAVVPAGLEPAVYDLTVINPDCQDDVLPAAFTVTWQCFSPTVLLESDSPVGLGQPMHLTATVISGTGPFSYSWDMGGAGQGEGLDTPTPVFTYTEGGVYTVTVVVTNVCGEGSASTVVQVELPCVAPTVEMSAGSPVELGQPMHFTATVISGTGPFSYSWDFGDGVGSSTETNPLYTYAAAGTYTVTLTVEGACGSDVLSAVVTVEETRYFAYLPLVFKQATP